MASRDVREADAPGPLLATPFARRLERFVLRFIRERQIVREGEGALVAASGGADSSALLVIMSRLSERLGVTLTAAHFDHMLRTREEAREDELCVRWLAGRLGIPVVFGQGDVAARARRRRESVEEAARRLRYVFLAKQARGLGATVVLLGHTVDDQAESVLLHILRGSGTDGLAGMRPRSGWPVGRGPDAGRPLLQLTREDTQRYCRDVGVEPREDPTNELLIATRNRIRHELLPKLREFNPRATAALARLAEAAATDAGFLAREADRVWRRVASAAEEHGRTGGRFTVTLSQAELTSVHPAVRARVLRRAFQRVAGSLAGLDAVHVEAVDSLLERRSGHLTLPHGVAARLRAGALIMRRGGFPRPPAIPETPLAVPGVTTVGGWRIDAAMVPASPVRIRDPLEAWMDAGAIEGALVVRSRRPGDRLRPLGLGGGKKVQDILVDARVPVEQREAVPLVCDGRGVVWVVGHRLDERVALRAGSSDAVRLRAGRAS